MEQNHVLKLDPESKEVTVVVCSGRIGFVMPKDSEIQKLVKKDPEAAQEILQIAFSIIEASSKEKLGAGQE